MGSTAVGGGAKEEKWLMKEKSGFIWPLFYVLFLHIVAFYFFTRGFLLTRTELSFVSSCSDAAGAPCQHDCLGLHMKSDFPNEDVEIADSLLVKKQKCWTRPAVDRLVIIVLDALRFDFVAPSTFFEGVSQLAANGKRVLLMGDDTWMQLFPGHFHASHPFPSFNVKDLDTKVVDILKNHSGPGELHENTFLVVLGDHGQTENGDHGGGTSEEVETSLFAMSAKSPPGTIPAALDNSFCGLNMVKRYIDQYAASSILRFPSEDLLRLAESYSEAHSNWSNILHNDCPLKIDPLSQNCDYINILLGQISAYSKFLGEVAELARSKWTQFDIKLMSVGLCILLASLLVQIFSIENTKMTNSSVIQNNCFIWRSFCSCTVALLVIFCILRLIPLAASLLGHNSLLATMYARKEEIFLYLFGGMVLFSAISFVLENLKSGRYLCQAEMKWVSMRALSSRDAIIVGNRGSSSINGLGTSSRTILAAVVVMIRACSLLSNSYILAEGKVAHFLLATTGILNLQYSIANESLETEAFVFLFLNLILRVIGERSLSKQTFTSLPGGKLEVEWWDCFGLMFTGILPMIVLVWVISLSFQWIGLSYKWKSFKCYFPAITILSYAAILVYWALEGNFLPVSFIINYVGKNIFPRVVYICSVGMIIFLACFQKYKGKSRYSDDLEGLAVATVAMLVAWSLTILMLSGRQSPLVAVLFIFEGWCIIKLQKLVRWQEHSSEENRSYVSDAFAVTQWNLVAVSLFYCLGHWCTFDGLHYGAAFIGFDEFHLIRQGVLLAIETFGVSHILPILALPLLVLFQYSPDSSKVKGVFFNKLIQVLLIYGFITAVTTTFTAICVSIQRRHLMVWGLFAPKYVFDVVGLILTDAFICLTSLFYL
ncbi:unnamed protein product [Victoria cruziana]